MKLLDEYFALRARVHDHFGYVEQWRVFPMEDMRGYLWSCDDDRIHWARREAGIRGHDDSDLYDGEIYKQRHLNKWVYHGDGCTMILVDTHTDLNITLMIFTDANRRAHCEL